MKGDVFRLNGASQEMWLWDGSYISLEPDTEIVQLTNRRIRMNLFRIKGMEVHILEKKIRKKPFRSQRKAI